MSTSLKVVSIAAVFCASLSRRAMVWRNLVMRTRSSRTLSSGARAAGAAERRQEWARALAGACSGAGAGLRGSATAASTSPFSTWPRLPLPAIEARSILSSAAILAAAGAGGIVGRGGRGAALAAGSWSRRCGRASRRCSARELAEQRADRDRLTGLGGDLAQDPRARRVDLERHLVGLELHQRLVGAARNRRPS